MQLEPAGQGRDCDRRADRRQHLGDRKKPARAGFFVSGRIGVKTTSAQATSLLLAGSLCLLPFLLPYHQQPLLSFYPEWLAAALGIAASLTLLVGRGVPAVSFVSLPVPARWLIAFAVFLAAQAASGGHAYSQLPLLAALYVLY